MWSWYILISSCYFCHTFNARLLVVIAKKLIVKSCKWFVFFQTTVISLPAQLLQKTGIFVCIITHTQLFNSSSSGTTWVGRYQKKHSLTHTHPDHQTSFVNFLRLLWSITYSLFNFHAWQSFPHNLSPGPLWSFLALGPSTSYAIHFFTQSSSFRNTCLCHRSLFCQCYVIYS